MPSRPCRILILSATVGGGHSSAATAIEEYYQSHNTGKTVIHVMDFFKEFCPNLNVLARLAYQQPVHFFPVAHGTFFELSERAPANPVVQELEQTGMARASAFIDEWAPDAIISTSPVAGGVAAEIKAEKPLVCATVITDFGTGRTWLHPATDLYFVACGDVREDLTLSGIPWERIVVSGVPISERFDEKLDRSECRQALGLADRYTVLVMPARGSIIETSVLASEIAEAGIQVAAVAGHDERLRKRLDRAAERCASLRVFGFTREMHRMMRAADVYVGKAGGLTVSEALAMRLPLLIFDPVSGQEVFNVDFLVNHGAGSWCRDESDVVEKVKFLSTHPERLREMADNAGRLGKRGAVQTVCERVLVAV